MPAERPPGGPTPRFVSRPLLFIRAETPKIGDVAGELVSHAQAAAV